MSTAFFELVWKDSHITMVIKLFIQLNSGWLQK